MSVWFARVADDFVQTFVDPNRWRVLLKSFGVTMELTALALCVGVVLGVLVAVVRATHDQMALRQRSNPALSALNGVCKLYLTVIRGTPVMVQLLIMYFIVLANSTNTILTATITFGVNSGAYVAEIIRAASCR